MTRITASLLLAAALAAPAHAAPPEAAVARGRIAEFEGAARAFWRAGDWEPMAEVAERLQFEGRKQSRSFVLGSYRKTAPWLKTGAFLKLQTGMRHDDDWVKDARGVWGWRDTEDRAEPVLVFDASPRAAFGGSWLGMLKTRLEHNAFNGLSLAKVQPEVSWFWLEGSKPLAHVSARYEADLRLGGRGRALVREQWVYLSALRHFPSGVLAGPTLSLRDGVFEESGAFKAASNGGTYRVEWRAWSLGLQLVKRFP